MALVVKDRVKETTITIGTSTLVLLGAASGFQSFSVIGDGNTTYYTIDGGTEWEVGIGTYTLLGTTLSRDTILESSNGGTAVNFSAGTKNVFVTYPAEKSVYYDASGNVAISITGSAGSVANNLTAGTNISFSSGTTYNGSAAITISASNTFPSGTRMSFQQTAAPTGWTKDTTAAINDSVLRFVTGTASSGGSLAFSTWAAQTSDGDTTLTTSQIPAHTHNLAFNRAATTDASGLYFAGQSGSSSIRTSSSTDRNATASVQANTGGGSSHNHSLSQSLKYYDFIIASKD